MKILPAFLLILFLLSACIPSEQPAPPTPPQTQIAIPTIILVSPTPTLIPTATTIPSATPDLRVITADPKEFLLSVYDLPLVGKYYLPKGGLSPLRNSEIIQSLGAKRGEEFIDETGRVDGWVVLYKRGASTRPVPKEIVDTVVMYQTAEGARLSIEKYWDTGLPPDIRTVLSPPLTGDLSLALSLTKRNAAEFYYYFSYRNFVHRLEVRGLEKEVTMKFVEQLAGVLLDKMVYAAVSSP